jgi:hypothetical protein
MDYLCDRVILGARKRQQIRAHPRTQKCLVNIRPLLIAHTQTAKLAEPGKGNSDMNSSAQFNCDSCHAQGKGWASLFAAVRGQSLNGGNGIRRRAFRAAATATAATTQ